MSIEFLIVLFILGLLFGSLGGMMVYRIPRDLPLGLFKMSRSICPKCKKTIAWYDNIPVFSFLILGGKCRHCKKKISIKYPIVELLIALSFVFVGKIYDWSPQLDLQTQILFLVDLYFFWSLVVITFIDLEFRIIPDRFSLGNWAVALLAVIFCYFKFDTPFLNSVLGGIAGFGIFFGIAYFYERVKKVEGMGFGDVKMMGWLGTWLGLVAMPILLLAASLTGLAAGLIVMLKTKGDLKTAIPFGPFLAIGAIIVWTLLKLNTFPFNNASLVP